MFELVARPGWNRESVAAAVNGHHNLPLTAAVVAGAVAVEGVGDRRAAVAAAAARAPPPLAPPARAGAAWRAASAAAAPLLAPALEQPPPGEPVEANCADRVGHLKLKFLRI